MPSSGARSGTLPSRTARGAGTGKVGQRFLTCGHVSPSQPVYRPSGGNAHSAYWCSECGCFKRRA